MSLFEMDLILVGINHRSAPIEIREQVALNDEEVREILARMRLDDVLADGDQNFKVRTEKAVSTDGDYNNLNPDDVHITNRSDE